MDPAVPVTAPYRVFGFVQIAAMLAFGVLWAMSFIGVAMCSDGGNVADCSRLLGLWIASGIAALVALALAVPMLIYSRPTDTPVTQTPASMQWVMIVSALAWLLVLAYVATALSPIPRG